MNNWTPAAVKVPTAALTAWRSGIQRQVSQFFDSARWSCFKKAVSLALFATATVVGVGVGLDTPPVIVAMAAGQSIHPLGVPPAADAPQIDEANLPVLTGTPQ